MPQTSYAAQAGAFSGVLDSDNHEIASRVNGEASTELRFGMAVVRGSAATEVKAPSADTDVLDGIVVHSHNYNPSTELGTVGVKADCPVNVLKRGRINVTVEEAVAIGDRLFVRYVSDGTKLPGALLKHAIPGEVLDCSAMGEFQSAAAIGGVAVLDFDCLNK